MLLKLKEIIEVEKELQELQKISCPIKTSYKLKRIYDKAQSEIVAYKEKRLDIIKKYGEYIKEQDRWIVKTENNQKAINEIEELGEVEIELEITKIKLSELGEIVITPTLLINWIFEE